ncbi:MAG: hypothetical protein DMG00_15030 [Acidobacteria bacterium]|nr:MAG: hypothetical protein DMG00_15030 [Acidobacteriota bacterium]
MRFDIARDDERRQLIVTVSGPVTTEEVSKLIAAVRSESVSTYGLLYDAREIDVNGEMTAYYIRDLAASARLRAPLGGASIAIVTNNEALHGLARMYASLIEGSGYLVEVFQDRESAARWLDETSIDRH